MRPICSSTITGSESLAAACALKREPVSMSPPTETARGAAWNSRSGATAAERTIECPEARARVSPAPSVLARATDRSARRGAAPVPANSSSGKSATVVLQPLRMVLVDQGHDDRALVDAGLDVRGRVDRAADPDVQGRRAGRPEATNRSDIGIEDRAGRRIVGAAVPDRRRGAERDRHG